MKYCVVLGAGRIIRFDGHWPARGGEAELRGEAAELVLASDQFV